MENLKKDAFFSQLSLIAENSRLAAREWMNYPESQPEDDVLYLIESEDGDGDKTYVGFRYYENPCAREWFDNNAKRFAEIRS